MANPITPSPDQSDSDARSQSLPLHSSQLDEGDPGVARVATLGSFECGEPAHEVAHGKGGGQVVLAADDGPHLPRGELALESRPAGIADLSAAAC